MIFILIALLFVAFPALAANNGENIKVQMTAEVTNSISCYGEVCVDAQNNIVVPDDFKLTKLECPEMPELPIGLIEEWEKENCEVVE